jgi:hypothetical protein
LTWRWRSAINVLIPILASGEPLDAPPAVDLLSLHEPAIVPAEEAGPGSVGLFSYPVHVWKQFVHGAREVAEPTFPRTALAGVETAYGEQRLVLPDAGGPEESELSLWFVDDDDLLSVVSASLSGLFPDLGVIDAAREVIRRGPETFRRIPSERRCANSRLTLQCAELECKRGACEVEAYYDQRRRSILYSCACHS